MSKTRSRSEISNDTPQAQPREGGLDVASLRLPQNFGAQIATRKETLIVPVQKPHKQWWVNVHPDPAWHLTAGILELKEERENFIVAPELVPELFLECVPKILFSCQSRQGVNFLWPIKMPDADGRLDQWNASALEIANDYAGRWIRVLANMHLGAYEVLTAQVELPDPVWPEGGLDALLGKAFKGKVIDTLDHAVIQKLRGGV